MEFSFFIYLFFVSPLFGLFGAGSYARRNGRIGRFRKARWRRFEYIGLCDWSSSTCSAIQKCVQTREQNPRKSDCNWEFRGLHTKKKKNKIKQKPATSPKDFKKADQKSAGAAHHYTGAHSARRQKNLGLGDWVRLYARKSIFGQRKGMCDNFSIFFFLLLYSFPSFPTFV